MVARELALPRILPVSDLPDSPWKNGRGTTRLIASSGSEVGGVPSWTISIATVTDGAPSSSFPGYERVFLPLERGSITLRSAGAPLAVKADGSSRFSGIEEVTARVMAGAEALALNVMTIRGRAEALVTRHAVHGSYRSTGSRIAASVVLRGTITTREGAPVTVPAVVPAGVDLVATDAEILEVLVTETPPTGSPAIGSPGTERRGESA